MESLHLNKEKIIRDIRNLVRLKEVKLTKLHCNERYKRSFQTKKRN